MGPNSQEELICDLRARLEEAEETLRAIREGEVDALVVAGEKGDRIYTLRGADHPYRVLMETMSEGAATLSPDGILLYCNQQFAKLLQTPMEHLIGSSLVRFLSAPQQPELRELLGRSSGATVRKEFAFQRADGTSIPVLIAVNGLEIEGTKAISLVATDLTERKAAEDLLRRAHDELEERVRERTAELTQSEARLRSLGDNLPGAAIYQYVREPDGRGHYAYLSAGVEKIFGMAAERIVEDPDGFHQLVYEADRQLCEAALEKSAREMSTFDLEFRQRTLKGELKWVHCRATPRRLETGAILWDGAITDITENREAQEALRDSERRYRSLFSTMTEGFVLSEIVFDPEFEPADLRMIEMNPAFEKITGHRAADLVGKTIESAFPGANSGWIAKCSQVGLTSEPVHLELFCPELKRHFEVFAFSFAAGKVACIFLDTTFRKQAEQMLQSQAQHLEQLVQERTAKLQSAVAEMEHFSYTITHDMRAPLRAMRGYGEILMQQAETLPPLSADFIKRINTAAERMDQLIIDALDYSKLVRQDIPLKPVDIQALIGDMLSTYPEFQKPKADICILGSLPRVLGNEAALTQCFSNLLNNAVKFVRPGQIPQIRIRAEDRGELVRFWLEDNGIGIPDSCHEKIFVMFQRLNRSYEGTGIGLALVKKAAERMGGRVGLESQEGKGSRFWLEFRRPAENTSGSGL